VGIPIPVEPQLDERTATAAANRASKVFADAGRDAGKTFSDGISGGAQAAEESMRRFGNRAKDTYDKATDAAGRLRAEEAKLQDLRDRGARNDQLVAQVERTERARRAEVRAVRDATAALGEYERARDSAERGGAAGTSFLAGMRGSAAVGAGREFAEGFSGGVMGSSSISGMGAGLVRGGGWAAAGVYAAKLFGDALHDGMAALQVQDLYQARLGVDAATMQRYGEAAAHAYANGFGGSIADNLEVAQLGIQSGLINRDANEADVQQLIQQSHAVAAVIGEDVASVANGTRNFVKTGLVSSYKEGFDLIVAASQSGLNVTHDLLASAEEYGIAFKAVGLSGADALGIIKQMSDAGIRNSDVASDALKELSINASDGSETTKKAFRAMGFDADDMTRRLAEGGPVARTAFGAIMDGLASIQDPVERNNVGLALYKTKWEDAKVAIDGAHLGTAASDLGKVDGATSTATETIKAHANEWDNLGRQIDTTFTKWKQWLADSAIGKFLDQTLPKALNDSLFNDPRDPVQRAQINARFPGWHQHRALRTSAAGLVCTEHLARIIPQ
jgi:hypothetical protein